MARYEHLPIYDHSDEILLVALAQRQHMGRVLTASAQVIRVHRQNSLTVRSAQLLQQLLLRASPGSIIDRSLDIQCGGHAALGPIGNLPCGGNIAANGLRAHGDGNGLGPIASVGYSLSSIVRDMRLAQAIRRALL